MGYQDNLMALRLTLVEGDSRNPGFTMCDRVSLKELAPTLAKLVAKSPLPVDDIIVLPDYSRQPHERYAVYRKLKAE